MAVQPGAIDDLARAEAAPADADEDGVYVFPTSYSQQRLWFLDQFEPGSPFYNIPTAVRIEGPLDAAALEQAIGEIVQRHESLRTTFAVLDQQPMQVVHPRMTIPLRRVDLRGLVAERQEAETLRLALEDARRPFSLTTGPLLRTTLLERGPEDHVLLLTMHHIISDGWSMGVFIREAAALYDAFSRGKPSPLPPLEVQYADFAEWQRAWLQGERLDGQLRYWKERLGASPPVLQLPTDRPRPPVYTSNGAKEWRALPKALSESLKALGHREGATLFMTLLAAFQTLLYRYTGQDDICVGTAVANRNRAEIENIIGFFVNTLVLRTDLGGEPTFRELLRRVREVALGAYAHQDLPFEQLVVELNPDRDMSHPPLFQVMFILQNTSVGEVNVELSHLRLSPLRIDKKTSNFDLTLMMSEDASGLQAILEYNTDLFEASTIRRMLAQFETLLQGIAAEADRSIARLPLVPEAERRQLLEGWNDTRAAYPTGLCVHQVFEAQVDRTPDATAVVFDGTQLTYRALNERANRLAHYLRRLGVGPEVLVGICVERSVELIVGVLGVLKAGGAYVPLDPAYPQDRLAGMLDDAQAHVLLTQRQCAEALPKQSAPVVYLDRDWETIARESSHNPRCEALPENLAYVVYTSGSTGRSKGVMVRHRSLVNAYFAWERLYQLRAPAGRHLQMASFSFDVFSGDLIRALCSGGTLVLCPHEFLMAPERLYSMMVDEQVDCAEFVPAVLRSLLQYLEESGRTVAFMRLLIAGSDSWYVGEYRKALRFCGPATRLLNTFGLTETTIDNSYFEDRSSSLAAERIVPIGRPMANQQIYVLDRHHEPVPVGVYGEIHIGGAALARGFRHSAGLTAERYLPNPFAPEPGARLFRTGDVGRYLPDGNVEFAGRIDSQVKVRGLRIELGEIEAALGQHEAIREVAVVVREDRPGDKLLAAYYVPGKAPGPSQSQLRQYLLNKLPDYMVPSAFVPMPSLPLTPNGKIDRRALPVPERPRRELEEDYVAPRTQVEELLAGIWSRVLGVGRVSVYDNFFAVGGHSLLATQVNSRLRDTFHVELPLRNLFEYPTVAALAERVEMALASADGREAPPIRPVPREGPLPLSFAQQRLWFLDQLSPGNPTYNIAEAYRVRGPLDVGLLRRCVREVVRRHEVLRTTYAIVDGQPVQVVRPDAHHEVPLVDLHDLPPAQRQAEVERLASEEARRPFDLARGPLLRTTVLGVDAEEHVILVTVHHIASDDWSTFVYLREVQALYGALATGEPSPLPELAIQYADYAHWQRQWLQGEVLEAQLGYWRKQLAGAPPMLELPTDRPRPRMQTSRGASRSFTLSEELSDALRQLSQQEGATLFMTLLAAFQTLLFRYTGQDDICVGSPVTNRTRSELEALIGFFVNTLALRGDLSGDPSFRELVRRVREVALGAYAHQEVPFEKLVDELQPERDMSRTPLFQVMLVMQNIPRQAGQADGHGLQFSSLRVGSTIAKFDLTLFVAEAGDRLSGALNYNTDLFDEATIARMLEHFQTLLEGIAADPDERISRLPLLGQREREQLLVAWNGKDGTEPLDRWLPERFQEQAAQTPDAVAAVFEDQWVSYGELNRRANRLAHYLQQRGVGPEVLVGVCLERSLEMLVGLLGVLKAGGAYVPLDPSYPRDRLGFMLNDARVAVLLTQRKLVEGLPEHDAEVLCLDDDWKEIARAPDDDPVCQLGPEHLAYAIYTSGSTGRPKGTLIAHRGLTNYLNWCLSAYPLAEGRGSVVHSTIAFDATITALFAPLLAGRTVRLLPEALDLDELSARLLAEGDYSLIKITPAHLDLLGRQMPPGEAARLTRSFVIGGENLLGEQIRFWQEHAAGTRLFNEYGPTENVVGCVVYEAPSEQRQPGSVPIGQAIPNTQAYVLDGSGQLAPTGALGELYLGGVGVARGYLNRPDLSAEKFVPDPFGRPGARLYRTGDLVRYRGDGNLEFLGRIDHQVKIRGYRIECGEIESVLSRHDQVREAVVVAREDRPGEKRLVAYCVPRTGKLSEADLRDDLRGQLPEYMVPSFFVELAALPLTANGKVDRRALPAPDPLRPDLRSAYVAPRTATEQQVAAIWADVLGIDRVGVEDHFFDLGGHSLLATQVVARVQQVFGIPLPLRHLFETPTVAGLSETIETLRWVVQGAENESDETTEGREVGEI